MLSPVTLPRSYKSYGAVMMGFVVPLHEVLSPEPRGLQVFEALRGKDGPVFVGPEERFRVGIIVAHPGPAPAGNDAQGSAGFLEDGSFHGAPVVRVEYQRSSSYLLGEHRPGYEFCRMFFGFSFPDLPAHDEAAVDVENQIEVVIEPLDRAGKPAYVPAPYPVRFRGLMGGGNSGYPPDTSSPMLLLVMFPKNTVEGGFRGYVFPPVRQGGNDLAWREIREFRFPGNLEDFPLFLWREGVERSRANRILASVFGYCPFLSPALD